MKGSMYGAARQKVLDQQNKQMIAFMHQPVGGGGADAGKQDDETSKAGAKKSGKDKEKERKAARKMPWEVCKAVPY
jgi:hypothetical protein